MELLQWQTVGNVFKLASWPLAFSLVAAGRSKLFLLTEVSFNIIFIAAVWLFLPSFGLLVTAIGFVVGYIVYFALVTMLVRHVQEFRWERASLMLLAMHSVLAFLLLLLAYTAPILAAVASLVLGVTTAAFGARIVLAKIGKEGRLAGAAFGLYLKLGWPIRSEV